MRKQTITPDMSRLTRSGVEYVNQGRQIDMPVRASQDARAFQATAAAMDFTAGTDLDGFVLGHLYADALYSIQSADARRF